VKRYAIAKVYRRDQPAMGKGRMREFYQCDFDVAGQSGDPMVADAEVLRIVSEVFENLGWRGRYTVKINHRKILDGLFEVCGVPAEKIRSISSAVDKLDKMPWSEVRKEMVDEKGLDEDVADRIEEFVTLKGGRDLLEKLKVDERLMGNAKAKAGIEDMALLMGYLEAFDVLDKMWFDLSLARGLDYYTGVIYEVITEGSAPPSLSATQSGGETAKQLHRSSKKEKKADANEEDHSDDPSIDTTTSLTASCPKPKCLASASPSASTASSASPEHAWNRRKGSNPCAPQRQTSTSWPSAARALTACSPNAWPYVNHYGTLASKPSSLINSNRSSRRNSKPQRRTLSPTPSSWAKKNKRRGKSRSRRWVCRMAIQTRTACSSILASCPWK
jgi:Histidyl-tRNA synthetase